MSDLTDSITFLGTAGTRFMVASQTLASGGIWLNLNGTEVLLDPGPGTLVQAVKNNFDASRLQGIILSHKHLDHSGDVNVMIEAMTHGGFRRRGALFAPSDALDTDPVVMQYLRPSLERIEILQAGGSYNVGNLSFHTPIRHHHSVETYGMVFETQKHKIAWLTDTGHFSDLLLHYKADLLVLNVVKVEPGGPTYHLSVPEAGGIIGNLKPKLAILNHFGMAMWQANPEYIAERLSDVSGVRVIAAQDGMRFDLAELD